jgi:hypothetical protein
VNAPARPSLQWLSSARVRLSKHIIEHPPEKGGHWEVVHYENHDRLLVKGFGQITLTFACAVWQAWGKTRLFRQHIKPTCGKFWCINPGHLKPAPVGLRKRNQPRDLAYHRANKRSHRLGLSGQTRIEFMRNRMNAEGHAYSPQRANGLKLI